MGTFVIITQLSAPTSEESAERNLIETIIVHGLYVVHGILPKSEFFNFNFNFIQDRPTTIAQRKEKKWCVCIGMCSGK